MKFLRFRVTDSNLPPLTKQEARVAVKMAFGDTKKEIAEKENKSIHTINQQARMVYDKTGSRNLADLTRWVLLKVAQITEDDIISAIEESLVVFLIISVTLMGISAQIRYQVQLNTTVPYLIAFVSIYKNYSNNYRRCVGERNRLFSGVRRSLTQSCDFTSESKYENSCID